MEGTDFFFELNTSLFKQLILHLYLDIAHLFEL